MQHLKAENEEIKQRNAVAKTDYEAKLAKHEADLPNIRKEFAAYTAALAEAEVKRNKMVIFRNPDHTVELLNQNQMQYLNN